MAPVQPFSKFNNCVRGSHETPEGAGCGKSAGPDLWSAPPRADRRPGLPGTCQLRSIRYRSSFRNAIKSAMSRPDKEGHLRPAFCISSNISGPCDHTADAM